MNSLIRRIAGNNFLAWNSPFCFLSSNREGATALRAVAPSLYLCILRKHDCRLFTNNRLCSIIELTSDLHKPFPPDCAAARRSPAGERTASFFHLPSPDGLRRYAAQVVRGTHLCANHFFKWTTTHSARTIQKAFFAPPAISPYGQRRCAALPVINFPCTILPTPYAAQRHRASVKSKKNIIEKLPFSPLENKLETDKTYAPFAPKWTTPQKYAGSAYACGVHRKPGPLRNRSAAAALFYYAANRLPSGARQTARRAAAARLVGRRRTNPDS